jgi:hypothetical protein
MAYYGEEALAHLLMRLLKDTTWKRGATQMSIKTKVQRIQELRRSNAAQPVRNKKKYFRKIKHKRRVDLTNE